VFVFAYPLLIVYTPHLPTATPFFTLSYKITTFPHFWGKTNTPPKEEYSFSLYLAILSTEEKAHKSCVVVVSCLESNPQANYKCIC